MTTACVRDVSFAILAGLALLVPALTTDAAAQQTRYLGSEGPVVLEVDPDSGLPLDARSRGDLRVERAVPVPTVMNGSGFGLTGTDYYSDGLHEGPLNKGRRRNEYVLAPALRAPPPR